jgi:hypothetical protein
MKAAKNFITIQLLLILMFSYIHATGQQEIDLTNLEVPNSPAFMLLDVAPTLIERPSSGKAFAMSILNTVNENNGIPQNYAVEFTPFWYFKHPSLDAFKYWGIDPVANKNKGFNQIKQSTVSFAYANTKWPDTSISRNINNLAFGVRGTIFQLVTKKNRDDLIDANNKIIQRLREYNEKLSGFVFDQDMAEKAKLLADSMSSDPILLENEQKIQEILSREALFSIDGATAVNWAFDGNSFSTNQLSLFGAWLTINYSQELNSKNEGWKNYLSFLMLARYTYDNALNGDPRSNGDFLNLLDFGGKLEFDFKQLSFSYEYIFRTAINQYINTFRSTGMAVYKISDKMYVLASLGKNFGDTNNLIAQFGINLGFGTGNEKVLTFEK